MSQRRSQQYRGQHGHRLPAHHGHIFAIIIQHLLHFHLHNSNAQFYFDYGTKIEYFNAGDS